MFDFADELEAWGDIAIAADRLAAAEAAIHEWLYQATGVVVTAAFGGVTLFHPSARESSIRSPELPFLMNVALEA